MVKQRIKKPPSRRPVKQITPAVLKKIAIALVIAVFAALVYTNIASKTDEARSRAELQKTLIQLQHVKKNLESSQTTSEQEKAARDAQIQELNKQLQEKEAQLQAKRQSNTAHAAVPVRSISGTKEQWMTASGIPQSQWHYVDYIVSKESGWDPCAYNPSMSDCNANPSSACGLAQSLPCGKQSKYGHWTDPVANLKWQYEYVTVRYGGYAGAYSFWLANNWY